jgi:hypothetical protein
VAICILEKVSIQRGRANPWSIKAPAVLLALVDGPSRVKVEHPTG